MDTGELQPIVIDFSQLTNEEEQINESFLRMFGFAVKSILKRMFDDVNVPVKVKGHPTQVRNFVSALKHEKDYLQAYKQFGLDDPRTVQNSSMLKQAVKKFERATGLKWPFK
jgi:hypothetical protein